jgi:AcrR family transcriptional regulator
MAKQVRSTSSSTKAKKKPARRDAGRPRGQPVVDAVLVHTLEELATTGLASLRVDRVAKAAGVNKTSVYRRFPTRDALVIAALGRVHDDLSAQLVDTGSLRGDLRAMTRSIADFLDSDVGRAVARAVFAGPIAKDVADAARAQLAARAAPAVQALIARAVARGEWRVGVDPTVVLAALVGGLLHRALLEQQALDDALVESLIDVVVTGVVPR